MSAVPKGPILDHLPEVLGSIRRAAKAWPAPIAGTFAGGPQGPFKVLISTVLSLRTKDPVTEKASHRLFAKAQDPVSMLRLSEAEIARTVYPVGFYRTKSRNILRICRILIDQHGGKVPDDLDTLLQLPGVGRKTANLVVTVGYGKPGICVDTHVHRISNRWGLVRTRTPEETEQVLRRRLPVRHWIEFNDLLVSYGQNLCVPISPFCSRCGFSSLCPRRGVRKSR